MIGVPDLDDLHPAARRMPAAARLALALLIIGLLGWGLAGWWQGEEAAGAYREGRAAVAAHHWAAAVAAFGRAGAWRDAPAQVEQARAQIQAFTSAYRAGAAAAARGDWPDAVRAYTTAAAIGPDESDAAAAGAAARRQLGATGLAGTVILVTGGAQPGLYLEPANTYLPGSTATSRVRAIAGDGRRFIYDQAPPVPGGPALPTPPPRSDFWIPSRAFAQARPVILVTLDLAGHPGFQPLPAAVDGNGLGVFLGDVLWWYAPRNDFGYYSYAVTYYDLRSGEGGLIAGPSGRVQPIAWQADGRQVALAAYASVPPGADPHADVYLADAHGTRQRTVGTVEGTIGASSFSADGRYLFCQTTGRGSATHTLYLADLSSPLSDRWGPPLMPVETVTVPGGGPSGLTATWLGSESRLLLDVWQADDERLDLYRPPYDLGLPTNAWTILWHGEAPPPTADLAALTPDGSQIAWRYRAPDGQDHLLRQAPTGELRDTPITAGSGQALEVAFAPRGAYLVYGAHALDGRAGGRLTPVFALPTTDNGPPVRLGERIWDVEHPSLALPAAGTVVALINPQHELHAVTYDGRTDLLIASDVAAIWDIRGLPAPGWTR